MSESRLRTLLHAIKGHTGSKTDARNQRRFLLWTAAWGATFLASGLIPSGRLTGRAAWVVAIASIILSLGTLASYIRFFREADELTRRIQMEGLAFGFGFGTIAGLSYQVLTWVGAPAREMSDLVALMLVSFSYGQIRATLRYR